MACGTRYAYVYGMSNRHDAILKAEALTQKFGIKTFVGYCELSRGYYTIHVPRPLDDIVYCTFVNNR